MSLPVPFKDFGSDNETLYQEYCLTFREAVQVFRFTTADDVNTWGSGGHVAGGWNVFGGRAARRGTVGGSYRGVPVKCSLPWRAPSADGGAVAAPRAGTEAAGGAVGGVAGGRDCAPAGGSGGVDGADHASGLGVGGEARGVHDSAAVGDGLGRGYAAVGGGDSKAVAVGSDVATGAVKRGKNYEKNKAKRERARAQRRAGNVSDRGKTLVSVRAAHPRLDDTWAERKIRENEMAIARMDAQMAKMKREQEDGTAEKRYKVEANLVQGQLDGAFALVPQQRVVSWAKTITSNGSSSTGSSGGKKSQASIPSVSSGLGSGSATTVSAREKKLEQENEKLRKDMEELQAAEIMKRNELRNAVDRKIHFRESEIISLKQKLQSYKAIYG